ncbi:MAG: helix-turn-helix transcriptional regulator [Clostridia bacterium]|nr:helix-turn-helix transcriptional regulator [Clostridia bacterium]
MSELTVEIGKRIRCYRTEKKMSQEELAEKCGLHPAYIGQVERGEKNASIESVSKIARGLEINLSRIFENIEDFDGGRVNRPAEAYRLVQSVPPAAQEKIIAIIKNAVDLSL